MSRPLNLQCDLWAWLKANYDQWWTSFFTLLGWLWLTRVSLLGLLLLFGLPMAARQAARALVIGAYDLHSNPWYGVFSAGLLLILLGWSIHVVGMLIISYGRQRGAFSCDAPDWMPLGFRLAITAGAVLNLWTLVAASEGSADPWDIPEIIGLLMLGVLVGGACLLIIESIHRGLTWFQAETLSSDVRQSLPDHDFYLLLKPENDKESWLDPFVKRISRAGSGPRDITVNGPAPRKLDPIPRLLRGYFVRDADNSLRLLPGQGLAIISVFFIFIIYLVVHWVADPIHRNPLHPAHLTAIVYVFLLISLLLWALGGFTFFLDAFRIPVLLPLLTWLVLSAQCTIGDHFYRIWPATATFGTPIVPPAMTAAQLIEDAVNKNRRIIVVAAAGGGIQSSAWTVRVLTGLEEMSPHIGDFASSIQVLSGVSGGSTGVMYFAQAYDPVNGLPPPRPQKPAAAAWTRQQDEETFLNGIVSAAGDTSLGETTFGLVYPDLLRTFLPFLTSDKYYDRGELMEQAWASNAVRDMSEAGKSLHDATLRQWQADVISGTRPAVILNSTAAEDGVRMAFSTTSFSSVNYDKQSGVDEFCMDGTMLSGSTDYSEYPGADLRITTAARMSATFPFVSPQARPWVAAGRDAQGVSDPAKDSDLAKLIPGKDGNLHLGDGGYFDNSGVIALVKWLDQGLTDLNHARAGDPTVKLPTEILVIQIEAFPETVNDSGVQSVPAPQQPSERGPLFQTFAPILTLYNVRGAGHVAFANDELNMMSARWGYNPNDNPNDKSKSVVIIKRVRFVFPMMNDEQQPAHFWQPAWAEAKPDEPPLSWHLRQPEQAAIENAWAKFVYVANQKANPDHNVNWDTDPAEEPIEKVLNFLSDPSSTSGATQ